MWNFQKKNDENIICSTFKHIFSEKNVQFLFFLLLCEIKCKKKNDKNVVFVPLLFKFSTESVQQMEKIRAL